MLHRGDKVLAVNDDDAVARNAIVNDENTAGVMAAARLFGDLFFAVRGREDNYFNIIRVGSIGDDRNDTRTQEFKLFLVKRRRRRSVLWGEEDIYLGTIGCMS